MKTSFKEQAVIVQSAVKVGNYLIPGVHHYDHLMVDIMHLLDDINEWRKGHRYESGYIDQYGIFYSTTEAILLAIKNGQLKEKIDTRINLSKTLWGGSEQRIVCSAIQYDTYVFSSPSHFDSIFYNWFNHLPEKNYWRSIPKENFKKGFIDNKGIFHDPYDALIIAMHANQLKRLKEFPINQLLVKDLY